MSSIFLLIGGTAIALGVVFSYFIAIRALQESRRSSNYLTRQQNTLRARRAFSALGAFAATGVLLIVFSLIPASSLPSIPLFNTQTLLPLPEFSQTPTLENTPENNPTDFILTSTPEVLPTSTQTPLPSIPLAVEALFKSDVTPQPGVKISDLKFSTHIENGLPSVIAANFSNPISQMYVFFTYDGLDQGVQWTALWYRDGALQYYETKIWDGKNKGFDDSVWEQSVDKWQPGYYEVQIFIGSEWKSSGSFTLTGNPPTITLTPTSTQTQAPSNTPTLTLTPSATATRALLPSATLTLPRLPSRTPSSTASAVPTFTRTSTTTRAPSSTHTLSPAITSTRAPAITATSKATKVPVTIKSFTPSIVKTPSRTLTSTPSNTPVPTASATVTTTSSRTPTVTPTKTSTITPTITSTPPTIKVNIVFTDKQLLASGAPTVEKVTTREILSSINPVAAVIDEYFKGPNAAEQNAGLVVYWNGFVGYDRIDLAGNGILHIYLKGQCKSSGTSYSIARPLTATVKQFPFVKYVKIYDEHGDTRNPYGNIDSAPLCLDPSFTPSPTITHTPTLTPTLTPSHTPTITFTPTKTATFTSTTTATVTPSRTATFTPSKTPTATPSQTRRPTATLTSTSTPRPTRTNTPTSTVTFTPTNTPTITPSFTPTSTSTATSSFTPTFTPTVTATATPSRTPLPTATLASTHTPRPTNTNTPTSTATFTPTITPSFTSTFTPSNTPTSTPSRTPRPTATNTSTLTPRPTSTHTLTSTVTFTPTTTPSFTPTFTPSNTPTVTATHTPRPTATNTPTLTPRPTKTNTPTSTATFTPTITPSFTPTFTPSNTPTSTLTHTPRPTATNTSTLTPRPTKTNTPTSTATFTPTITPSFTPTFTPSNTPTSTLTLTPRPTNTNTPTSTVTFTPTTTPSFTPTFTPSNTPTVTATHTPRPTATNTPSLTPRPTKTNTPTVTSTFTPTITATGTPSFTPSPTSTATFDPNCYQAKFVSDITMPDGTNVNATEKFTKTWRFKNIGTCAWTTSFKFVFIGGDKMDASDSTNLPNNVAPNETVDISIDFVAPATPGAYKGIWSFEDNAGRQFGLGSSANGQIWIQVKVVLAPTNTPTTPVESTQTSQPTAATSTPLPIKAPSSETLAYDFVSEICSAQWSSDNNQQPCPGSGSDAQNTVQLVTLPTLEDGTTLNNPAIMISPGNTNGSIQGIYPEYLVQPGDHFRAIASCEENSVTCSALFRVSYQDGSNAIIDLWAVGEFYDKKYTQIDIDISTLAGQKVKFILNVTPLNVDPGNHAFWASPGVYREALPTATSTIVPTATQTATNTPLPTATLLPSSPTPTSTPQTETESLSTLEKIQKFFNDIFKNLFGG